MFDAIKLVSGKLVNCAKRALLSAFGKVMPVVKRTVRDAYKLISGQWDNDLLQSTVMDCAWGLYVASGYYIVGVCATVWVAVLFSNVMALLSIACCIVLIMAFACFMFQIRYFTQALLSFLVAREV